MKVVEGCMHGNTACGIETKYLLGSGPKKYIVACMEIPLAVLKRVLRNYVLNDIRRLHAWKYRLRY